MNTMFLLLAEFESATIKLSVVAERFMGMRPATAEQKASEGRLPIPTFRVGDTQKSPRLVHVQDLANYIDIQRAEAQRELERCK
ncbi:MULTISPECIES: pyocin activator PrtN family protein [unclassified Serratia (in: enterobacteria)]|uniref:pyocin activator PrtN family protein n=1 Tax=unclassified Serratia (in: enterobacteria) TaxID=2647522 RepID=UPI0027F0AFB1|nr:MULTISPECIES: pyocin activator PrtN family protein [unclassified Serratia (in: enterobacteria)]MDQ7101903.1 pyocin activator PrtN family protein [Serratia sp. MF2]MDQ7104479.1 pyocin activator PrtN family protein [Serratia sp. MF1(2023)]